MTEQPTDRCYPQFSNYLYYIVYIPLGKGIRNNYAKRYRK